MESSYENTTGRDDYSEGMNVFLQAGLAEARNIHLEYEAAYGWITSGLLRDSEVGAQSTSGQ